jgi:Mg-chelatase subunit ChlD
MKYLNRCFLPRLFLLCSLLLLSMAAFAQTRSMKLSSNEIDFGRIAAVKYPAKIIEFTNSSDQNLAILIIEKSASVQVGYEHRFYKPGEKGIISVYYLAGNLGEFNEEIKIYTNLEDEPYSVTLKGTCISINECFPNQSNLNLRNIMVVNKETQEPVPYSTVIFTHNFAPQSAIYKMDKAGKAIKELPIGQYNAKSTNEGFEPYDLDFFLPRSQPNVLIELTPKKTIISPVVPVATPVTENPSPREVPTTPQNPVQPVAEVAKPQITSTVLPEDQYAANNIVLLLDVSSSMNNSKKLTLLQQSVNNLVLALRSIDNVSIITYAGNATVLLSGVPGSDKDKIMGIVQDLKAYGITQGVKGLNTAYDLATQKFIPGGNNQIILATDGEFSEKNIPDEYYVQLISGYASKGIKLSILGFGVNQEAIARMKLMTTAGQGTYIHVASEQYIKDILINEIKNMSFMGSTIEPK